MTERENGEDGVKVYAVGGCVRDALLGRPVVDRDWVVVGATSEAMQARGFRPVGADFPVFLHPETQEEYALARTERKTAPGYRGFVVHAEPTVTLEEDLRRRDLTINAMARDADGKLIDPYGGAADLRSGVLRHVSEAFAEDPVRILRVARFAARFGFSVAPETMALMKRMVESGEADHLVPERVWQEVSRGLQEPHPERLLGVLCESGALARVLPELADAMDARGQALAARRLALAGTGGLAVRFALLTTGLPPAAVSDLCNRVHAPGDCRDLALLASRESVPAAETTALDAEALLSLLERTDALRRPERLEQLLEVWSCHLAARDGRGDTIPRETIEIARGAAHDIDAKAIADANPGSVPSAIRAARVERIRQALARRPTPK